MLHILRATKETVHWGYFDAALGPALKVKSGDHIHVQAITHHAGDAPDLMMDDAIRQLIIERQPVSRLKEVACAKGTRFLRDSALDLARQGRTTLQEVNRVTFVA